MQTSRGLVWRGICGRWLPAWLPTIRSPWVRSRRSSSEVDPGPGGLLASFTAGQDEVTPGAGPLRTIPVQPQVALPAQRALLAADALAKTHPHTVTRHRARVTMPRPLLASASPLPAGC